MKGVRGVWNWTVELRLSQDIVEVPQSAVKCGFSLLRARMKVSAIMSSNR